MTRVARITVFPIKSLDGLQVPDALVLASGALCHDRRYALQDAAGRVIKAKRRPEVQRVRAEFPQDASAVRLSWDGRQSEWLPLPAGGGEAAEWIGEVLSQQCTLIQDVANGLPDDTDAPGPTLISTQSLQAIADWFELSLDETRRRMRANIEFDAPEPFWEDRLVGHELRIGGVRFLATGVCQRCAVPSRNSLTGEATPGFQKGFAARREAELPAGSPRDAFNHFYCAAINTRLVNGPGAIRVGDPLALG